MKSAIPSLAGFAAEDAAEEDKTAKIGFKINCKDNFEGIPALITAILDEFVYPEVMVRVKQGILSDDFRLFKAHILMYTDESRNQILLNDEVRFVGQVQLVQKQRNTGDPILLGDIEEVLALYPSEQNDPNAAHLMLFRFNGKWLISCDFFYNKERNRKKLETGKDFLKAAHICMNEKISGPFVDNLFSATELAIQSLLLFQPMGKFSMRQNHPKTAELLQENTSLGNLDTKFWKHFTELRSIRLKARYLVGVHSGTFRLDLNRMQELIDVTKGLINYAEKLIGSITSPLPYGEYVTFGPSQ